MTYQEAIKNLEWLCEQEQERCNCEERESCEECEVNVSMKAIKKAEKYRWIPCSERFPEERALFTNRDNEYLIGFVSYSEECEWYEVEDDGIYLTDVIAWMPLPPVFKGE